MLLPAQHYFIPYFLLGYLLWQYSLKPTLLLFILGMGTTLFHQWLTAANGLPSSSIIRNVPIKGRIIHVPNYSLQKSVVDIKLESLDFKKVSARIRLSCYFHCPPLQIGDMVAMKATLKKPHDLKNPGSFSFQQWAWAHHIDRLGSFQPSTVNVLGNQNSYPIEKLRGKLYQSVQNLSLDGDAKALIAALTLGISNDIRPDLWKQFRDTGTAHLMVISGAHVGLITGLCFFLFSYLYRSIPRITLYFPAQRLAAIGALGCALFYALIAGFAVPAQRSVVMSAALLSRYLTNQYLSSWQAWQIALFLCVAFEPHCLVMPGFYLSFIAVAVLLITNQRIKYKGLKKMVLLQVGCLLGLMPFTLYIFSYQANNGLLANLVLIPYVSLVLLPLGLFKVLMMFFGCGGIGDWLFNQLVKGLIILLTGFQKMSLLNWQFALQSIWQICGILLALFILILVPKRSLLLPAFILLAVSFIPVKIRPLANQAKIVVFDVGQGLSILIATQHHQLLYDTGLQFYGGGGDIGTSVILPFFRYYALRQLDSIVVSHPDLDHRGGLNSISHVFPNAQLISDSPRYYRRGHNCHSYSDWTWDGIHFEFLPLRSFIGEKNNHSCVLKISSPSHSILLTGDIEREAETYLVNHYKDKLKSDVLVVPHHGSKTSSSQRFLEAVSPTMAIISSGVDNKYHFPHGVVIKRLKGLSIQVKNTAEDGMIEVTL
ncbi:DNA internalization-related competence protein ComEC/Rec2 [Legionella sp. W05-934-2]|uniref:DNA internalization-related competence protein ComEC/Rec2 n=1 Tax=Legionella sp. W05-934-2 TaxID=1198649 RepID=UPI00346254C6